MLVVNLTHNYSKFQRLNTRNQFSYKKAIHTDGTDWHFMPMKTKTTQISNEQMTDLVSFLFNCNQDEQRSNDNRKQ